MLEHDRPADLPIDHPLADFRGGLAAFSTVLPHTIQSAGRRDLPAMLADLAREVERRHGEEDRQAPAIYLFICDLGRFRDLRRDENDMGFSFGSDKPVGPATLLGNILRDGPAVGVYTLVWCDSLTAVQRCFDRQGLREFALRVLLQMSSNDSSHLIDVPLASKLGPHVALFHNEEEGRLEKFRPTPGRRWSGCARCRSILICACRPRISERPRRALSPAIRAVRGRHRACGGRSATSSFQCHFLAVAEHFDRHLARRLRCGRS